VVSEPKESDPIFAAIEAHKRKLDRRNQTIEAICAAEDRHKAEERDAWHRYAEASIALLTTKPTTIPEGATENAAVVQALIDNLIKRGLDPKICRVSIIDAPKALSKVIRRTIGAHTPIQRCQT
jgi:hypothetical protein